MQLFLGSNEGFVSFLIEFDVSQYSSDNERPDLFDRWFNCNGEFWLRQFQFRGINLLQVDLKGSHESGFSEQIRSVVHTVELVVSLFL